MNINPEPFLRRLRMLYSVITLWIMATAFYILFLLSKQ